MASFLFSLFSMEASVGCSATRLSIAFLFSSFPLLFKEEGEERGLNLPSFLFFLSQRDQPETRIPPFLFPPFSFERYKGGAQGKGGRRDRPVSLLFFFFFFLFFFLLSLFFLWELLLQL